MPDSLFTATATVQPGVICLDPLGLDLQANRLAQTLGS